MQIAFASTLKTAIRADGNLQIFSERLFLLNPYVLSDEKIPGDREPHWRLRAPA